METQVRMKGSLIASYAVGNIVNLWFSSPTGDSSDSLIFTVKCETPAQAQVIAKMHSEIWGL